MCARVWVLFHVAKSGFSELQREDSPAGCVLRSALSGMGILGGGGGKGTGRRGCKVRQS